MPLGETVAMSAFNFIWVLLPLALILVGLVLLKRIADTVDRLESTIDRRLLGIQKAISPVDADAEGRWPPEE
jgi:hypothetical protein